jgi:hypothetical protein
LSQFISFRLGALLGLSLPVGFWGLCLGLLGLGFSVPLLGFGFSGFGFPSFYLQSFVLGLLGFTLDPVCF